VLTSGDGGMEFTASGPLADRIAGLAYADAGAGYQDIAFGLNVSDGGYVWLVENGQFGVLLGTYESGDRLRIAVVSGTVRYYRNGTLLHESAASPNQPVRVDTSLYGAGAVLADVIVTGAWQDP